MTQVTKMLIQANTLQLTYLLYIIINVSNLSAYMSLLMGGTWINKSRLRRNKLDMNHYNWILSTQNRML